MSILDICFCRGVPTCTQQRMCIQLDTANIGVFFGDSKVLSGHKNRQNKDFCDKMEHSTILLTCIK